MPRELALAHLTAIELPPPRLIDAAAAAGFEAVTLRLLPARPGDPVSPLVTDRRRLIDARTRLEAGGISLLEVEALHLSGSTPLDDVMPGLEAAAALGARHVLVVGDEPDEPRLAARLNELCERAAPLGLRPVLEFIPFTAVSSLGTARRVVEGAAHPAAGILVDALHLQRSGGTTAELARLAAERPRLLPYAQLCDAPLEPPPGGTRGLYREAVGDRRLPGDGALPLWELLGALPPGAPLSVEAPVAALAQLPAAERVARIGQAVRDWLEEGPSA